MWEYIEKEYPTPPPSKFDRLRNWASELLEKKEIKKQGIRDTSYDQHTNLLQEIRKGEQYAENPKILSQIRSGFESGNTKKETGKSALLIQLPNGKYHSLIFDHSKMGTHPEGVMLRGQENLRGIIFPVDWGEVTVGRAGDFNGYNTQFTVTYAGKDWRVKPIILAYQYAAKTPEYRALIKQISELKSELKRLESLDPDYVWKIEKLKEELKTLKKSKLYRATALEISRLRNVREKNIQRIALSKWEILNKERQLILIPEYRKDVVYTPYSESIDTPKMRQAGISYLSKSVRNTWKEQIRAQSNITDIWPLGEVLDPRVGIVLAIIERMDFIQYLDSKGGLKPEYKDIMEAQIRSALTIFGANRETASIHHFNSTSKATGIAQITPMAHRLILDRYRENILPERDYGNELNTAGRDPVQSLRFMQVHLYDQLNVQTPSGIKLNWANLIKNRETMFGYYGLLAAGYNGDMTRVKKEAFNGELSSQKLSSLVSYDTLVKNIDTNKETLTYVLKFRYVWEYLERNHREVFGPEQPIVKK